jgi:hypothetical protein
LGYEYIAAGDEGSESIRPNEVALVRSCRAH